MRSANERGKAEAGRKYASLHLDLEYAALLDSLRGRHQNRVDLLREMIDERLARREQERAA